MELRAARGTKTINEIMAMLEENSRETGMACPSESSVRNVLTGDLNKISGFNYEGTLHPLRDVLLPSTSTDALLEILRLQEEAIKDLTAQLAEREAAQQARCRKCEEDMAFYKAQIAIKDRRMERKDRWIAELLKLPKEEEAEA